MPPTFPPFSEGLIPLQGHSLRRSANDIMSGAAAISLEIMLHALPRHLPLSASQVSAVSAARLEPRNEEGRAWRASVQAASVSSRVVFITRFSGCGVHLQGPFVPVKSCTQPSQWRMGSMFGQRAAPFLERCYNYICFWVQCPACCEGGFGSKSRLCQS
eukprot:jgi/Botrbrau1/19083/Bobra.0754s0002.1